MSKAGKKVRFAISLLMAFCLLQAVIRPQLSFGAQGTRSNKKIVLFAPAFESSAASGFAFGRRSNSNFLDGLNSNESILRQVRFDHARQSSRFSPQYKTSFAHRADRNAFQIRAPPFVSKHHT
jgi:hypothetical protein